MAFLLVLLSALAGLAIAGKTAPVIGLVDKPNARKLHQGQIPLVGGISLWVAMSVLQVTNPAWLPHQPVFWVCISLLLLVGVLDDKFDLPVLPRVIVQASAAGLMMNQGLGLWTLGEIVPGYTVTLGSLCYLFTLLAIWASINAFNMVDGIDGLLGGLSCVTFGALGYLFFHHGNDDVWQWCLALVLALLPYLAANLGLVGGIKRKVFMGDAGSTVIGFAAVWLLIVATQSDEAVITPATALWLIAVPLADMCAVSLRRLRSGTSPFRPDRGHIHHIVMKCGFSSRQTLGILLVVASGCAVTGIVFDKTAVPEWVSLLLFLLCFAAWLRFSSRVYRR
ncbi:UDP-N-acetylglucosamine--undecaprenyl-phosphate N-acetylglucosaminephosphotransferase [Enterobacter sp. CC120223-11]|uniref:UDP-N-acetylglucosamine--undecaprenyl-phosphate N-acetylglucosaminephosphotransferase n=1 Tax=Enterobacter sp. CC120223-11 TaxID=1378073 RepID=UPI000BCD67DF|nr:UDP-N-acetylglucosamine--undecaprenyl-phosphate N-acetylglucosaminephosphotransferase [Enterobacter sp. CC120223-11]SNY63852.1 UDP-GlcNAc:undecaprenyl-phosphate GlcNAc-1-phosphate transferase [Enterobacter sp. CC120223-11]